MVLRPLNHATVCELVLAMNGCCDHENEWNPLCGLSRAIDSQMILGGSISGLLHQEPSDLTGENEHTEVLQRRTR